jgi:hypothetical protein
VAGHPVGSAKVCACSDPSLPERRLSCRVTNFEKSSVKKSRSIFALPFFPPFLRAPAMLLLTLVIGLLGAVAFFLFKRGSSPTKEPTPSTENEPQQEKQKKRNKKKKKGKRVVIKKAPKITSVATDEKQSNKCVIFTLAGHSKSVLMAKMSPDGKMVATVSADGSFRV